MKTKFSALLLLLLALSACGPQTSKHKPSFHLPSESSSSSTDPTKKPEVMGLTELQALGWTIPPGQNTTTVLPPQPGKNVLGVIVKGGPDKDTNWTAFTLVLFLDENSKYQVLTQKRAIKPKGVIETAGGHLTGGLTWGQGAQAELEQEAGITIKPTDFIFLNGGIPKIGSKGNLFGNANFVVAFKNHEPATSNTSNEVDKVYGHQWIDLKKLYQDMKTDEADILAKGYPFFADGKYYGNFRGHVLRNFCTVVMDCEAL